MVSKALPDIAAKGFDEVGLNPATESDEVPAAGGLHGLNVIQACCIVGIGMTPDVI
jgi:uncharacterized protein